MLKKCAILGLAVLLVGGSALGWLLRETRHEQKQTSAVKAKYARESEGYLDKYGRWYLLSPDQQNQLMLEMNQERQTKNQRQLAGEQQVRLRMDLEKLAAGEMNSGEIADFLYGVGWEEEVRKYEKHQEQKEIARTTSIVCIAIGGMILGGCTVVCFVCGIVRVARAICARRHRRTDNTETSPEAPELTQVSAESPAATDDPVPRASGPRGEGPAYSTADGRVVLEEGFLPRTLGVRPSSRRPTLMARKKIVEENPMDMLMSDEPLSEVWSPDMQWSVSFGPEAENPAPAADSECSGHSATAVMAPEDGTLDPSINLKEQAEDLQKQLAEFKQVAQSVQQATRERSEPLSSTLKDLAQQVSAIREYAAAQQNRVEKLQDGYDWSIIRTFCLRVIRCIDNVEKRISDLGDDEATSHLEEVRDEMLFALESSGVEQYEPQINSDYRGQEKFAEAVKAKQASNKPDQAGRIARVLRPGYRYVVDDGNFKVVRTAQVKLFG